MSTRILLLKNLSCGPLVWRSQTSSRDIFGAPKRNIICNHITNILHSQSHSPHYFHSTQPLRPQPPPPPRGTSTQCSLVDTDLAKGMSNWASGDATRSPARTPGPADATLKIWTRWRLGAGEVASGSRLVCWWSRGGRLCITMLHARTGFLREAVSLVLFTPFVTTPAATCYFYFLVYLPPSCGTFDAW